MPWFQELWPSARQKKTIIETTVASLSHFQPEAYRSSRRSSPCCQTLVSKSQKNSGPNPHVSQRKIATMSFPLFQHQVHPCAAAEAHHSCIEKKHLVECLGPQFKITCFLLPVGCISFLNYRTAKCLDWLSRQHLHVGLHPQFLGEAVWEQNVLWFPKREGIGYTTDFNSAGERLRDQWLPTCVPMHHNHSLLRGYTSYDFMNRRNKTAWALFVHSLLLFWIVFAISLPCGILLGLLLGIRICFVVACSVKDGWNSWTSISNILLLKLYKTGKHYNRLWKTFHFLYS